MRGTVIARLLVAAAAVAVATALVSVRADDRGCRDAGKRLYELAATPGAELGATIGELERTCHGAEPLATAAAGLRYFGRTRAATAVARRATDRDPASYEAWAILSTTAPPGTAAAARRRALKLNPLAVAPEGR